VHELAELGYRMVIFPQTIFRATMRTAEQLLRDLKSSGTQQSWLDRMQSRKELYALLDYDPTK
jgi:methylisocitrate lyase